MTFLHNIPTKPKFLTSGVVGGGLCDDDRVIQDAVNRVGDRHMLVLLVRADLPGFGVVSLGQSLAVVARDGFQRSTKKVRKRENELNRIYAVEAVCGCQHRVVPHLRHHVGDGLLDGSIT